MIFDTDVLIWFIRGNRAAAELLQRQTVRAVSVVSLMELYRGARSGRELKEIRRVVNQYAFGVIAINESISHLAVTLIEEHALKNGLQLADALIAATAREKGAILATGNIRHFRPIHSLDLKAFHPSP